MDYLYKFETLVIYHQNLKIKVIAINNLEGRSNGYYRPLDKFMHHLTELQKRATMEIPKENKHTCDSTN